MITPNYVLDAKGFACPMPIVKTKKTMKNLEPGQVLEIQATDKGSTADLQAWAKSTGHEYLGTKTEGDVLHHFLRKDGANTAVETTVIPEISLENFKEKVENGENLIILDVRELDEYEAGNIQGAIHIPLGEVEQRSGELKKDACIYVICHSGRRSELAAQTMAKQGFQQLINVVPGMCDWTGETVK